MKAAAYDRYGSFDVIRIRETGLPPIGADQALIRVNAASIQIGDCFTVRGSPLVMRLSTGMRKPKYGVPGYDVAGVVTAVGPSVSRLAVGDAVFGTCRGACAEFAAASEATLAPIPSNLSMTEAAAIPIAASAALHAIRDVAKVRPGQRMLINGAAGGIGTFAVQIAKTYGAEVTAVCSEPNADLMRDLGADRVIDYAQEDFTTAHRHYDVIFDNVENRSLAAVRRALAPSGTLVLNSGTGAHGFRMVLRLVKPFALAPFTSQKLRRFLSAPNTEDLLLLKRLVEARAIRPVIDKVFELREIIAALNYVEAGHARGKVMIVV